MKEYSKFINKLFESREQSHAFHLQSENNAEHLALQDYYEKIITLIDDLVEIWQGKYLEKLTGYEIIEGPSFDTSSPLNYLIELSKWIEENKSEMVKDDFLLALVDEVNMLLYKTIYKLKFLD